MWGDRLAGASPEGECVGRGTQMFFLKFKYLCFSCPREQGGTRMPTTHVVSSLPFHFHPHHIAPGALGNSPDPKHAFPASPPFPSHTCTHNQGGRDGSQADIQTPEHPLPTRAQPSPCRPRPGMEAALKGAPQSLPSVWEGRKPVFTCRRASGWACRVCELLEVDQQSGRHRPQVPVCP